MLKGVVSGWLGSQAKTKEEAKVWMAVSFIVRGYLYLLSLYPRLGVLPILPLSAGACVDVCAKRGDKSQSPLCLDLLPPYAPLPLIQGPRVAQ